MANRITLRHGSTAPSASNLLPYELGWNENNLGLYIGQPSGEPLLISSGGGNVTGVKGSAEQNYRHGNVEITAANIGLGNVENTKLSTWAGSTKITTLGTITTGIIPWARISDVPAGATKEGTVTSITLKAGTGISLDTDNTAITTSGTRTITNSGVRSTTINGNYLRVNTNGTNADLTIPYATSAGSVAWGNVSGKPSTFAPSAHTHYELTTIGDQRSTATTPNTYSNKFIFQGLKSKATIGSPSDDTYSYVVGLRGWSDSSGGDSHELAFNNTGLYWRHGATTSWGSWNRVYTTGNKPTASDVGLGNVENKSSATIRGELTSSNVTTALGFTPYNATNPNGYTTNTGTVTSITLKAGTGISLDTDNTAITTSGTRTITNSGVRATTINGNYLRVNTNGTNADLTIPYATSAGSATTASKLGSSNVGAADRPIYLSSGTATQTTYRMAGTNAAATTALSVDTDLDTGIWYVSGTSGIYNQFDGVIYANKYNNSWISEIYQDYRTGQLAIRGKNNGTWQSWRKVLDSSNWSSFITLPIVPSNIVNTITTTAGTHTAISNQKGNVSFNIPTKTSHLTNDSGYLTSHQTLYEENIQWGPTTVSKVGSVSPIGMSLSNEHSANRLAFINGDALTFEYSSDGGATYTNYNYINTNKTAFCTTSYAIPIGRVSGNYTTSSRTRMTLTAQNGTTGYVYTNPKKLLININSSGGMQVLIEYRTGTNYQNNGNWVTFGTYNLSGWSGWNDIPLILGTLGGGTTQTNNNWQLRLTFIMTSVNSSYPTSAHVLSIRLFGDNGWSTPSTMATTGHLYSYDSLQNAIFPAQITATAFNGNATSATKATQDGNGAVISSTYLKLSGGTLTGVLTAKASLYEDSYSGALNMNNSNIYGVNSIYTADASDNAAEGIHFYRDTTHVDTLWINGGDLLFVPNRELGTSTTKANSQKVGRFTANPTTGQVVVTDGTTGGIKTTGYTIAKSVPSDAVFTDTWTALSTSAAGYVAKAPNDTTKFLRGDASWATLPAASTNAAGIIKIGTTAGDAAAGNHTHTLTLVSTTDKDSIALSHGSNYKLTAGGSNIIFKMPEAGSISFPSKTSFEDNDALLVCTLPGTTNEQYNYVQGTLANPLYFRPSTAGTENKLLSQKGTWETIGAWAKSTNKPTYTSSEITKAVIGNGRVFYGTCNSTASTAEKAVTCSSFVSDDLVAGTMIIVKFSITNTASISSLTLNVNSTTAKSIRYIYNGSYSTIPGAGYLKENQIYKFIYDGTYWIVEMSYDTNTNTLLRTYASSTNIEVPLIAQSSANSTTAAWTSYANTSKDWYGVIPNADSLRAKINLSTGHITIPGGITSVTPATGNNSALVATTAFVNTAINNAVGAAIGGSY